MARTHQRSFVTNSKRWAVLALPVAAVLIGLFFGLRIRAELFAGQPVFWLAELWTPAAVLTVVVVVCIDFVTAAPKSAKRTVRPDAKRRSGA